MSSFRRPWSWSLYILSQLIYLLGLSTLHPLLPRWLFFVAFAIICVYLVGYTTFPSPVDNYSIGSALVTVLFNAMDYLVLRDVQKEVRMEGQKVGEIEKEPFGNRLKWSATLVMSQRSIGWIDPLAPKVPHIPPAPTEGRKALVLAKIRELALNVIAYDLLGIWYRTNPTFKPSAEKPEKFFLWRLQLTLGFIAGEYLIVTTLHCAYCILSVGFGLSEPRHWPALFGSVSQAYSIRRLWSRTWHQLMRRLLISHSNALIKYLHLSPESSLSLWIRSVLSFLISGFIHACGDFMIFHNWRTGGSLAFFMLQPFGMAFETAMMIIYRRLGIQMHWRVERVIAFVWVLLWFCYTIPIMLEPLLSVGFFQDGPRFSLILGIRRGEWIPEA